jgi:BirA family biotin operon repressor/biotin-[acetyl-CoA-carboxylase] ligase
VAFDVARIRAQFPDREIVWIASTASTMAEVPRLAPCGVVVADEQTAGQGRFGRRWHSPQGAGLYVSIALAPRGVTPALTLALGLAAAEAVTATAGLSCDLRWPNDVLVGGKKCGGVLVQLHEAAAIAGIGINVNQTAFPEELSSLATSLRLETGRDHSREDLLIALLHSVDRHVELLARQGSGAVLDLFASASSYVRGRRVAVDSGGEILRGSTDGLDPSGFLWLRLKDGSRRLILSGGVRPI